ncbi:MAG TPA: hypothetical protein VJR58_16500 [Vineibacter sp.]|nr:hypothetical protein [Vineibacter sp.]
MNGEAWAIDGATLTFVGDGGHTAIRLWGIDAPALRDGAGLWAAWLGPQAANAE